MRYLLAAALLAGCSTPLFRRAAPIGAAGAGLASLPVPADPPATFAEKTEMRAGWVVGWRAMTSTASIDAAIDAAQAARLNALFVQVRVSGDAYYRSDLVPRAQALKDQPADFDPLDYALTRAHEKGLKVHAWMNTGVIWRSTEAPTDARHVFNAHPDWILSDESGRPSTPRPDDPAPGYVEENYWINWGHPDAQKHLIAVVTELVDRYPVDGVHFDFVRYPARMGPRTSGVGYDPVSVARFRRDTGLAPAEHTRAWDQWRTDRITEVLTACRDAIKRRRPGADVSAAVLGAWNLAYGRNFTDYRGWLDSGVLDYAVLMSYYKDPLWVRHSALNALERAGGKRVVLGLQLGSAPPERLAREIELSRTLGLRGFALFALDRTESPDLPGYLARLRALAIPDAADARYASAEPLWNRVGVADAAHRRFTGRFFSRTGRTKVVVYPRGLTRLTISIEGRPLRLPPLVPNGLAPLQVDLSADLNPAAREVVANHDFLMAVSADGPPDASAQIFTVDYYDAPSGAP